MTPLQQLQRARVRRELAELRRQLRRALVEWRSAPPSLVLRKIEALQRVLRRGIQ
jgi:hypothetical protein